MKPERFHYSKSGMNLELVLGLYILVNQRIVLTHLKFKRGFDVWSGRFQFNHHYLD